MNRKTIEVVHTHTDSFIKISIRDYATSLRAVLKVYNI